MISYRVHIVAPRRHTALVEVEAAAGADGLTLVFPAWTPGSYLLREFSRYAGEPVAADGEGRALAVERGHHGVWRVAAPEGTLVRVAWEAWCHELTVRTPHIDGTHAFFTGSNLLPLVEGRLAEEVRLEVRAPEGWTVFCPLDEAVPGEERAPLAESIRGVEGAAAPAEVPGPVADGVTLGPAVAFAAADYDLVADAIVEAGPHRHVTVDVEGVPHRLILWEDGGTQVDLERLARETADIVQANAELFGGLPYPRYDFLFHITDSGRGGLEHLNGTALAVPWRCFESEEARAEMLTLITHEHLHVWNGKRIRPEALGPFDYLRENHTRALWVVEGLTVYMDELLTLRAGCIDVAQWLKMLGQGIRRFETTPGRFGQSLADASIDAWIRLYRPDANSINRTVSYYLKGGLVWLCLDLHIRRETGGERSVDDVLRALWAQFERDGKGYADDALPGIIREATRVDVAAQVAAWVDGRQEQPDVDAALASHGLRVERTLADAPDAGLVLQVEGGDTIIRSVLADGPNAESGFAPGDVLVAVDGRRVKGTELNLRPGSAPRSATTTAHVFRRGVLREVPLNLAAEGVLESVRVTADPDATGEAVRLRDLWLGTMLDAG